MDLTKRNLAGVVVLMLGIASAGTALSLHASRATAEPPARTAEKPKAASKTSPQTAKSSTKSVLKTSYLRDERMQRELKLTKKQLADLQEIRQGIRAKHKKELEKAGVKGGEGGLPPPKGLSGQQYSAYWKIEEQIAVEEQVALVKALPDILKPDQRKRLRQISLQEWQAMEISIFLAPEVVETLKLTKEQQKKIVPIAKKTFAEIEKKMRQGPVRGDIPTEASISLEDILKIVKAARETVMTDVLTAEQRKVWKEMLGKSFHFGWEPEDNKAEKKG
jgi:hypothetical protein